MSLNRCFEEGYCCASLEDSSGRRGLWYRTSETKLEICAGREGDDEYCQFDRGTKDVEFLIGALETLAWVHSDCLDFENKKYALIKELRALTSVLPEDLSREINDIEVLSRAVRIIKLNGPVTETDVYPLTFDGTEDGIALPKELTDKIAEASVVVKGLVDNLAKTAPSDSQSHASGHLLDALDLIKWTQRYVSRNDKIEHENVKV